MFYFHYKKGFGETLNFSNYNLKAKLFSFRSAQTLFLVELLEGCLPRTQVDAGWQVLFKPLFNIFRSARGGKLSLYIFIYVDVY